MTSNASTLTPSAPSAARSAPRLRLEATLSHRGLLDGGWWPRTRDPVTELPGLITGLQARIGPVRRISLNKTAWDSTPHRLMVGGRSVRLGWFRTLDAHTVCVTSTEQDRLDLLVIPPESSAAAAALAMTMATAEGNTTRPAAILTTSRTLAASSIPTSPSWAAEHEQECCWESEGGRICDHD